MPKLVTALLAIGAILIAAVMLGPGFVDWNHYKPEIIAQASKATGRIVSIDGAVDLSVLPAPTISVGGVRVANIEPAEAPDMISLRSLEMRIALLPLLYGEIQVLSVRMVEPVIRLERFADGSVNWRFGADTSPYPAGTRRRADDRDVPVALDNVEIAGGRLTYSDAASGVSASFDSVDARLSAPSLNGPFTASGRGRYDDMPFEVEARVGELVRGGPVPLRLELASGGSRATFAGSVRTDAGDGEQTTTGTLQLRGDRLGTLLRAARSTAAEALVPAAMTDKPFDLSGRMTLAPNAARVDQFKVEVGDARGEGRFTLDLTESPRFDIAFAFNRLDLDALLLTKELAPVAGPRTGPRERLPGTDTEQASEIDAGGADEIWKIPRDLNGTVDLKIDALLYRRQIVRQAVLNAGVVGGTFNIQRLSALLPGGSDVTLFGSVVSADSGPRFAGRVEATSDNLRALLDWMALGIEQVPADRLRKLVLSADIDGGPTEGQVTNIDVLLDSSRLVGGIAYVVRARPAFGVNLRLDRINIDGYLPLAQASVDSDVPAPGTDDSAGAPGLSPLALALAPLVDIDADFVARVDQLTYRGVPINEIVVDGLLQSGTLTLREARIADAAGARAGFSGTLTELGREVGLSGQVSVDTADLGALSRLLPAIDDLPRSLTGPIKLETAAQGSVDRLAVDGALDTLDGRLSVKGTLSDLIAAPSVDVAIDMTHPDLAQLLDAFGTLDAASAPAIIAEPVAVNATLVGGSVGLDVDAMATLSGGDITLTGNLDLFKPQPRFDLTGRAAHPDLARLVAAATGLDPSGIPDALAGPAELEVEALGAVEGFDLVGRLGLGQTTLSVDGRVDSMDQTPGYTLDLRLENPSFAQFASGLGAALDPAPGAGPLLVTGRVIGGESVIDLPNVSVTLGGETAVAKGDIALDGTRPKLTASVVADEFVAAHWLALSAARTPADAAPAGAAESTAPPAAWSGDPIDLSAMAALDVDLGLTADRLRLGDEVIGEADAALTVTGGVATLSRLTGTAFGAELSAEGRLDSRNRPNLRVRATLRGADAEQVLTALGDVAPIRGNVDIVSSMSARGRSAEEMIASLNGTAEVASVGGGEIVGVDIARLSAALDPPDAADDVLATVRDALSEGTTRYTEMSGRIDVLNGVARTDDMAFSTDSGDGALAGTVDLRDWTQELTARFQLAGHSDAPPIGLRLTGPVDTPRREIDSEAIERYVAARAVAGASAPAEDDPRAPGADVIEGLIRGAGGNEAQRNMLEELLGGLPPSRSEAEAEDETVSDDAEAPEPASETAAVAPAAVESTAAEPAVAEPAPSPEPTPAPAPEADGAIEPASQAEPGDEPETMAPPAAAPPAATPEPASAALAPEPAPEPDPQPDTVPGPAAGEAPAATEPDARPEPTADPFDNILEDLLREP